MTEPNLIIEITLSDIIKLRKLIQDLGPSKLEADILKPFEVGNTLLDELRGRVINDPYRHVQMLAAAYISKRLDIPHATVRRSVYTGWTDPGEWAKQAILVMHHESGLYGFDYWHTRQVKDVEEYLSDVLGKPAFFEPINGGVTALWYV